MGRRALLVCGILSSALYGAMIWVIRFQGYSRISQTPSELSAIGVPTRPLWMLLGSVYDVLVVAFGLGVYLCADRKRAVRAIGGLLVALGMLGLIWPFASMHQREVTAAGGGTVADVLHIILSGLTVLFILSAIGFGVAAFGKRFRVYSIVTLLIVLAFGALTGLEGPRIAANLPTPWVGLWERISIAAFLVWVIALAITLSRAERGNALKASDQQSAAHSSSRIKSLHQTN
jgi:hypothetical protein